MRINNPIESRKRDGSPRYRDSQKPRIRIAPSKGLKAWDRTWRIPATDGFPILCSGVLIGRLKGSSSHWVNHICRPGGGFAWQGGYGVLTVADGDLDRVCGYVRDQVRHHQQGTTVAVYEDLTHRST